MMKNLLTISLLFPFIVPFGCGGDKPTSPMPDTTPKPSDMGSPVKRVLSIQYDSPLPKTDTLQLNGMILPAGPWVTGLCPTAMASDTLACDLTIPAGATAVWLSVQVKGGSTTTYSCSENPCGIKKYQELGRMSAKLDGTELMATLIDNQQGCGCNHEFKLK